MIPDCWTSGQRVLQATLNLTKIVEVQNLQVFVSLHPHFLLYSTKVSVLVSLPTPQRLQYFLHNFFAVSTSVVQMWKRSQLVVTSTHGADKEHKLSN